jgi:hypothetical protein
MTIASDDVLVLVGLGKPYYAEVRVSLFIVTPGISRGDSRIWPSPLGSIERILYTLVSSHRYDKARI